MSFFDWSPYCRRRGRASVSRPHRPVVVAGERQLPRCGRARRGTHHCRRITAYLTRAQHLQTLHGDSMKQWQRLVL
ncbi:hypothetical protein ACWERI_34465 [Streptomyces collinus]